MDSPPNRLKDDVQLGLTNYVARLAELLAQCASEVDRDPETFLWHARRVLEVVCLILYSISENRLNQDDGSAGDLDARIRNLKKKGLATSVMTIALDNLRQNGNLGVHVRNPDQESYRIPVNQVRTVLPDVVDWLFVESVARHYIECPESVDQALRAIRGDGSVRKAAVDSLQFPRHMPPRRWGGPMLAVLVVAILVGIATTVGMWVPVVQERATEELTVTAKSPSATRAPTSCPMGMILAGVSALESGTQRDVEGHGSGFCIDPQPRTWTQFSAWPPSRDLVVASCSWRDGDRAGPVGCVSLAEAEAYCESLGGSLPNPEQWASMIRRPEWGAQPSNIREWLDGSSTEGASGSRQAVEAPQTRGFVSRATSSMDAQFDQVEWDDVSATERGLDLGFRCAADPT